jgi:hypothetical protein
VAEADKLQQETILGCGWHGKMVVVLRETGWFNLISARKIVFFSRINGKRMVMLPK